MVLCPARTAWRKNQQDVRGILLGGYPPFVFSRGQGDGALGTVPVFSFHQVKVSLKPQLEFLRINGYETLEGADALHACLTGGRVLPRRGVLLTFDDGFSSLYETAFPLLQKYRMHAVSFVVPAFVGKPGFCTWGQLRRMQDSGWVDVQSHSLCHRCASRWPPSPAETYLGRLVRRHQWSAKPL